MEKVDKIQAQMSTVSLEMEILKKNQKEMLKIQNSVTVMKNAFDQFTNRPYTEVQREKTLLGGGKSTPKNYGAISKNVSYM